MLSRMLKRVIIRAAGRYRSLRRLTVIAASRFPSNHWLNLMRATNSIQLDRYEMKAVAAAIKKKASCRFLIFGAGNDSLFWTMLNRRGITVFLEDDQSWLRKVSQRHPGLDIIQVDYETERRQWQDLLASPESLHMQLPDRILDERWDVVLVDGPAGWKDDTPGRMKSIHMASRLATADGDVFVHDCERQVEQVYCDRFLGRKNLAGEIGPLRHYRLGNRG
jgi:uncharacterized protein (TIGR01627 family)